MKTNAKLLHDFIRDFNLENDDHSVCFNANIEFNSERNFTKIHSEVHLITLQKTGLSVLYLLDPDIAKYNLPDSIPYSEENFTYRENEFLQVRGSSEHGSYTLTIYPIERTCYPETTAELKKKKLN